MNFTFENPATHLLPKARTIKTRKELGMQILELFALSNVHNAKICLAHTLWNTWKVWDSVLIFNTHLHAKNSSNRTIR